jgi:hypothetical protein
MIPPSFPSAEQLRSELQKLESAPGSVILVAVEPAEACCNFCKCTWAWLSREERKALKTVLERARKKRASIALRPPSLV